MQQFILKCLVRKRETSQVLIWFKKVAISSQFFIVNETGITTNLQTSENESHTFSIEIYEFIVRFVKEMKC